MLDISKELAFPATPVGRGSSDRFAVKRIQEWLTLQGIAVAVDSDFGPATEKAVKDFQFSQHRPVTGAVDKALFELLTTPLRTAFDPSQPNYPTLGKMIPSTAMRHLVMRAREVGGDNRGPWVRAYCGSDGDLMYWCAGFVCTVVLQVKSRLTGSLEWFKFTLSCDELAAMAKKAGKFVSGSELLKGKSPASLGLHPGAALFLVRKSPGDWIHTGLCMSFDKETTSTVEGNTNNDGSRNGYAVASRVRAYSDKLDFVSLL